MMAMAKIILANLDLASPLSYCQNMATKNDLILSMPKNILTHFHSSLAVFKQNSDHLNTLTSHASPYEHLNISCTISTSCTLKKQDAGWTE